MLTIKRFYDHAAGRLEAQTWILPSAARLLFAGVLASYFFTSGLTKLGSGFFGNWAPSAGAYIQIFPNAFEQVGYDPSGLSVFHHAIVYAGIFAEFLLPILIIVGFITRLAALGMIGFIILQSITDIYGHGQHGALGSWFDRFPDAAILDQRAFWIFVLLTLLLKGAGPISVDRMLTSTKS